MKREETSRNRPKSKHVVALSLLWGLQNWEKWTNTPRTGELHRKRIHTKSYTQHDHHTTDMVAARREGWYTSESGEIHPSCFGEESLTNFRDQQEQRSCISSGVVKFLSPFCCLQDGHGSKPNCGYELRSLCEWLQTAYIRLTPKKKAQERFSY